MESLGALRNIHIDGMVSFPPYESILNKSVIPLMFGTARYGTKGEKDAATGGFVPTHDDDAIEVPLLQVAIQLGYGCFDTAEAYGDSEVVLGDALYESDRDALLVATKVGIRYSRTIMNSIVNSIERLGTVPDILYIHNRWEGNMGEPMDICLRTLDDAIDMGRARSLGISNFQPSELERAIRTLRHRVDFYQAKMNLTNPRTDAADLLQICQDNGILFVASVSLDRGNVLSMQHPSVLDIAKKYDMTPAQVGIFAVRSLGVMPIVQSHSKAHMNENLEALTFSLEESDVTQLQQILLRQ